MESLHLKFATFTPTEVVLLRKRGNIIIKIEDIRSINYTKPTFWTIFKWWINFDFPEGAGAMTNWLNKKISNQEFYNINIRYKDFLILPEPYKTILARNY